MNYVENYIQALWQLSLDAAPWLVLGLVIGGLFKSLIPTAFLHRHLTQPGLSSILKAAVFGVPLPLCSCGVIPAAMGLRQAGASQSATTSFLVSTPETGVDSISISYAMLGPFMAIIRPIAALFSAVFTGLLVLFFADKDETPQAHTNPPTQTGCCSQNACSEETDPPRSLLTEAIGGIKYAFNDLYPSILKWLVIGLLFAALVQTFVPTNWLLKWGDSWVTMLMMLLVGIPMYVCATGSTPIAAGFLMAGISPGAVLVYLLAGPATNMATLGVVRDQMGIKTMWLYLFGIIASALLMGISVNAIASGFEINTESTHAHEMVPYVLELMSFVLLLLMALVPLYNNKAADKSDCCDS